MARHRTPDPSEIGRPLTPYEQFLLRLHRENTERYDRLARSLWVDRLAIIGLWATLFGRPVLAHFGLDPPWFLPP